MLEDMKIAEDDSLDEQLVIKGLTHRNLTTIACGKACQHKDIDYPSQPAKA